MTDLENQLADALLNAAIQMCNEPYTEMAPNRHVEAYALLIDASSRRQYLELTKCDGAAVIADDSGGATPIAPDAAVQPAATEKAPRKPRGSRATPAAQEPEPPAPATTEEPAATPTPEPAAAEPAVTVTHEDCRKLYTERVSVLRPNNAVTPESAAYTDRVKALVTEFNAASMAKVKESDLPAFHAKLLALPIAP